MSATILGLGLSAVLLYFVADRPYASRRAERAVRSARRLAPFEADYDLKRVLLIYSRGKDGAWLLGWSRMLRKFRPRGLAVQSASVTVIFRRSSSFAPSVVILQQSREWPAGVLRDIGITLESVRPTSGVPGSPVDQQVGQQQDRERNGLASTLSRYPITILISNAKHPQPLMGDAVGTDLTLADGDGMDHGAAMPPTVTDVTHA